MEDIIESKLTNHLLIRKEIILDKWIKSILDGYQSEGAKFFSKNENPFQNPVGTNIKKETELMLSEILGEMDKDVLGASLEKIIKIRSIQDFSASEAVSFIFILKSIIADELNSEEYKDITIVDVLNIYTRIDRVLLMAFDIYMHNRERISQIKINEIKKKYSFVNMDRKPK